MGTSYIMAVAFTNTADPTDPDAVHLDAQYGFAQLPAGGSPSAMGSSGSDFRHFETVEVDAGGNGFVVALLTPDFGVDQGNSFVRVSFRPAHDVAPTSGLATSPLNPANTTDLERGLLLSTMTENATPSGANYGLPTLAYNTLWQSPSYGFSGGVRNTQTHFEITVEVTVAYSGTNYYFKVDPEMIIRW